MQAADVNLVVGGTAEAITMVEGGCNEASEADMLDVFDVAHDAIKKICATLDELREEAGVEKLEIPAPPELNADVLAFVKENGEAPLRAALAIPGKHERKDVMKAARNELIEKLVDGKDEDEVEAITSDAKEAWEKLIRSVMRGDVIKTGKRLDGRATDEIRDIWCETGIAPRAHGSGIFTRGETQTFVTVALGTEVDAQRLELPYGRFERNFMLTYNFAPFCTGEARPLRGPKRREIGHGALAIPCDAACVAQSRGLSVCDAVYFRST